MNGIFYWLFLILAVIFGGWTWKQSEPAARSWSVVFLCFVALFIILGLTQFGNPLSGK